MSILLRDPTGHVEKTQRQKEHTLDFLAGKRVGYVFNQHISALAFWKAFEQEVERTLNPSEIYRMYKEHYVEPAPTSEVDRLVRKTDFALVGVGA